MKEANNQISQNQQNQQPDRFGQSKPFDTQISQQAQQNVQDKGFSPWIKQKSIAFHHHTPQQLDYHRFLANIKLSPRSRRNGKKNCNPENENQFQMLKADLACKINAQKINNGSFIDEKTKPKTIQSKNFFQRRANISKLYRRPKSIDISLQFQPKSIFRCTPLKNQPYIPRSSQLFNNTKAQYKSIHKLKKKKNTDNIIDEEKKFMQTAKEFRLDIIAAKKKMYQTLEINISQIYRKTKKSEPQNEPKALKQMNCFNRPKFAKPKSEKPMFQYSQTLACLGRNAITFEHKSCKQKIKSLQFKQKNNLNQLFVI